MPTYDLDSRPSTENNQELVERLSRFRNIQELRNSHFGESREKIRKLLDQPRTYRCRETAPRLTSFLRVAQWNIERGTRLDGIIEALNSHPVLKHADILLLNELDNGMLRSGNRDITRALAEAVSANAVFGVEYLELTRGTGEERRLVGENTAALHGNAILSRYPVSNPRVLRLPRCENNFESVERRVGGRIVVCCELAIRGRSIVVATTHLDVVNSPRCRGRQMQAALLAVDDQLAGLPDQQSQAPAIVGGDLNTHTFARGGRINAIRNTMVILGDRSKLKSRLRHPERREPAVAELRRAGFEIDSTNDRLPTSSSVVSRLDDSKRLPSLMKWWVQRRVGPGGVTLELRLDWLASRNLRVLAEGEAVDAATGVPSVRARTLLADGDGSPLSDHHPIVADLTF